jgi:RHS repeat-associated protein
VPHYFDAGSQYKAVETARLRRERNLGTTFYGWDGDTLAWETTNEESTHYFYEPDSFVPLAQGVQNHAIQLHSTPDWTDRDYSLKEDPLWTQVLEPEPFDKLGFYHCDHLGTPQEMTDEEGNIAWQAQYKAWGEAKEIISKAAQGAGFKNPLRFQGQYFDHETGLHYNRYRYYDPETGRFISKDPIRFEGGVNLHVYAPSPTKWVDPMGLEKKCKPCLPSCTDYASRGPKDEAEMARELSQQINKNSVTFSTPTTQGHIDLQGASHYDKNTGTRVDTPHVQTRKINIGPEGQVTTSIKTEVTRGLLNKIFVRQEN